MPLTGEVACNKKMRLPDTCTRSCVVSVSKLSLACCLMSCLLLQYSHVQQLHQVVNKATVCGNPAVALRPAVAGWVHFGRPDKGISSCWCAHV